MEHYTAMRRLKHNNKDTSHKYSVEWKKPDTEDYTLYDSIYRSPPYWWEDVPPVDVWNRR